MSHAVRFAGGLLSFLLNGFEYLLRSLTNLLARFWNHVLRVLGWKVITTLRKELGCISKNRPLVLWVDHFWFSIGDLLLFFLLRSGSFRWAKSFDEEAVSINLACSYNWITIISAHKLLIIPEPSTCQRNNYLLLPVTLITQPLRLWKSFSHDLFVYSDLLLLLPDQILTFFHVPSLSLRPGLE